MKKYGTLPPKDFNQWARICEHVIRHYNEGWADGKGAVMLSYFCEDDSVTAPKTVEITLNNLAIRSLTEYPLDKERSCEPEARDLDRTVTVTLSPNTVTFLLCNSESLFAE